MIDELLKYQIVPFATLYHWDLPQALQDIGGWENRAIADAFVTCTRTCFEQFSDRVEYWITFNEVINFYYAWLSRWIHPPGIKDERRAVEVNHIVNIAHAKAVAEYRQSVQNERILNGKIGIAHVLLPGFPISDWQEDIRAWENHEAINHRWFYDPVLLGEYPQPMWEYYQHKWDVSTVLEGDQALLQQAQIDSIGVNYYQSAFLAHNSVNGVGIITVNTPGEKGSQKESSIPGLFNRVINPDIEYTDWDWVIYPKGLYEGMRRIQERYGNIPILITENGMGQEI